MKRKSNIPAVILSLLVLSVSCNKSDGTPTYPSHLAGQWVYTNASSGYTGVLSIEDIDGGQYAYFSLTKPTKVVDQSESGSFEYDSATGKGYIDSGLLGSRVVHVAANTSGSSTVEVVITQLVSASVDTVFQGTFSKKEAQSISTGRWTGTKEDEGGTISISMDITSLEPVEGKCGALKAILGTEAHTATITDISSFAPVYATTAVGVMALRDDEDTSLKDELVMVFYDLSSRDIIISDFGGKVPINLTFIPAN